MHNIAKTEPSSIMGRNKTIAGILQRARSIGEKFNARIRKSKNPIKGKRPEMSFYGNLSLLKINPLRCAGRGAFFESSREGKTIFELPKKFFFVSAERKSQNGSTKEEWEGVEATFFISDWQYSVTIKCPTDAQWANQKIKCLSFNLFSAISFIKFLLRATEDAKG